MNSILVICGDPGGAAAVAPVLAELRKRTRYRVYAIAYNQACKVWQRAGLDFQEHGTALTDEAAAEILDHFGADLVLTGTSGAGNDLKLEQNFIAAARARAIPSLALLDFWSDYRVRFSDVQGRLAPLPDRIAVMDRQARDEMIAEGFDPERLVITGHPAFDLLEGYLRRGSPAARVETRRRLMVRAGERLILFLSQPLGDLFADDPSDPRYLGYTEKHVRNQLVEALSRIADRRRERLLLVVRPHPREALRGGEYDTPSPYLRYIVSDEGDGREIVLAADLVAGMFTILLMEAYLMGCPVVSLQPGLKVPDPLPVNRSGLLPAVYEEESVEPVLERMLDEEVREAQEFAVALRGPYELGATLRVVQLACALIKNKKVEQANASN